MLDGPRGYYAKWSKSVRKKQIPYYFIYMWNLKNDINKQNKNWFIDTENRLTSGRGEGAGGLGKKTKGLRSTDL